jgi:zinc protease
MDPLPFEEHVLDNGLRVLLHPSHGAPVVSLHLCYHVGSACEAPGKTGFAHLFEHLLFQGSQHVASDGHFRLITEAGGTLNGNTSFDRTLYYETLPANQLELALWLESDRMGFFLSAMDQRKLDNQRDVVRNEKRQNYELKPYAKAHEVLAATLFPGEHPYAHLPIGSHADLESASLADVKAFFERWYRPDNATLALGGAFEPAHALERVQHWFGAIPRGGGFSRAPAQVHRATAEQRRVVDDNVQLPQVTLAWPTPQLGHADEAALNLLAMVLSASRSSLLDRALTIDDLLAKSVSCGPFHGELAGRFQITATAANGVAPDRLELRIRELLADAARDGVSPAMVERMRNRAEADFVQRLDNVSNRTSALALSDVLRGHPLGFWREYEALRATGAEDVRRVLQRYLIEQAPTVVWVVPAAAGEREARP